MFYLRVKKEIGFFIMSQNNRLNEEKTATDRICFLPVRKIQKLCERLKKQIIHRNSYSAGYIF